MNRITLCREDRYRYVAEFSEPSRSLFLDILCDNLLASGTLDLETALERAQASRIVDLEDIMYIHYVPVSCDLRALAPASGAPSAKDHSHRAQDHCF